MTLALMQSSVANEEDGWRHARDILGRYYERVLVQPPEVLRTAFAAANATPVDRSGTTASGP